MRRRSLLALAVFLSAALAALTEAQPWGWVGVRIRDLSEREMEEISSRHGIEEGYGVMIVEILANTPAARANLKNGDLIVAFKGLPVVDTRALQRVVASTTVGDDSVVTVLRSEGRKEITVRVGAMPPDVAAERIATLFGFGIREPEEPGGVPARPSPTAAVAFVREGSPADRAGLESGDVIVEVNSRRVFSRQNMRDALLRISLDHELRLMVSRGRERVGLTLAPPGLPTP
ncbi:MAG: PDZ domain-containing protein [Candidatus Methylomirabilia bacterium]